jgi:hypothetical protein
MEIKATPGRTPAQIGDRLIELWLKSDRLVDDQSEDELADLFELDYPDWPASAYRHWMNDAVSALREQEFLRDSSSPGQTDQVNRRWQLTRKAQLEHPALKHLPIPYFGQTSPQLGSAGV